MTRFLVVILALGWGCLPAPADDFPVTTDEPQPMQFAWRTEGPAEQCGETCRTWISAIGTISEHTARDFEAFANDNNVQGATLVLDSVGGSVLAALELGTLIRRFDMTTTVGKTIALPSDDGEARAKLSPAASCQSMCAFLLLGDARRSGEIGGDALNSRLRDLLGKPLRGRLHRPLAAAVDYHVGSSASQSSRDSKPDAGSGTGHYRLPFRQVDVHRSNLMPLDLYGRSTNR